MERNRVGREASPDCNRSTQVNTRSAHPQDAKQRTKISSSSVSHTASSTALDASGLLNHTVTLDPPSVVLPGARGRRRLLAARVADAFERQATNEQKRFRNQRPVAASPVHRSRDPMAMAERGLRHVASHSPPKTRSRTAAASGVSQPTLDGEHNKGGRGASPFHRAATRDASSGFLHELSPLMSSQIMPSWQQLSNFLPNSEVANRPDPHAPSLGKSASLVEKSAEALRSWTQHQASTKSAVLHPRRQMQDTRTHTPPPPPHQITPVPLPLSAASPFPEPMHPQSPLGIPPNAATQETNDMKVVTASSSALEGVAVKSATAVPSLKKDTVFENASQDVLSQSGEEDDQPHIQLEQTIPRRRSPNISCGASSSGDADSISMDQQHADAGRISLHDRTLELSSLVKTRVRRMNHHAKHRTPQAADSHSVIIPVCTTSGNPTVQELESIQHLIGQLQTYVSLAQRESSSPPSCSLSSNEANMAEDETAEQRGQNRMFFGLPAAEPLGQEDSLVASSESSNGSSHSKPRRVNPKFPCFDRILADVNSKSAKKNFQSSQSPTSRPGAKMTPNAGSSGTSSVDCTMDGLTNERYERVVHHIESVAKNMPAAVARTKRLGEGMDAWLASWNALQSVSTVFGEAIYADLLRANPKYRYLFICAMEATTTELRPSQRLTNMLKQAVMAFLIPEETVTILTEMGARHQLYRVHEEHYAAMQRGFFKALKQFLPTSMYTASLPSWRLFWRVTVDMLVCGLHSDRGRFYEEKYRELWACRVQQLIPKLLQKQKGRNGDECDNHFFVDVFNRALEQDPSIIRFQRLRTIRTSDRAMESLRRIVEHLNNRAVVETYLEDLSSKHESYGISSTILKQFKRPFLETFAQYMSDEPLYSPVAARAMAELWDYITSTWSSSSIENSQLEVNNAIAPHGDEHFCLMFTDVEASTRLWDYKPEVMAAAVQNHHRIIRSLINDYDAYEVKTVGDSFLIATKDALTALKIALAIQLEFMRGPIAKGFKMVEHTQGGGDPKCWRDDSLRIRIGIHYCTDVSAVYDTVHQRYDYYGPDVNCAARVEASACGGQVLMTKAALDALHAIPEFMTEPRPRLLGGFDSTQFLGETTSTDEPLSSVVSFVDEGCRLMKGIADPVQLFGVIHRSLAGREFEDDTSRTMSMSSFDSFIASSMIS